MSKEIYDKMYTLYYKQDFDAKDNFEAHFNNNEDNNQEIIWIQLDELVIMDNQSENWKKNTNNVYKKKFDPTIFCFNPSEAILLDCPAIIYEDSSINDKENKSKQFGVYIKIKREGYLYQGYMYKNQMNIIGR